MFYRKHPRVTSEGGGELLTKQEHKDECDINLIIKQYHRTGVIHLNPEQPTFDDLPSNIDYQEACNTLIQADAAFAALPARTRDRFGNDPSRLLSAMDDPDRRTELEELGILKPKPAPEPPPVPPADKPA